MDNGREGRLRKRVANLDLATRDVERPTQRRVDKCLHARALVEGGALELERGDDLQRASLRHRNDLLVDALLGQLPLDVTRGPPNCQSTPRDKLKMLSEC